nr:SNF2 helicase-associated domain-containing protein [Actinomadura sp. CNU-125]
MPDELLLDTAGAFRFLRQAAPMLAAAGFGVLLPHWAGKAKLGMKLTTRTEDPEASSGAAASSGFDLKAMIDFRWELAIGDGCVDEDELAELARLKTPLVRLRGQWVELDEEQLEAALDFLRHPRRGRMSAAEAIRAIVHAGDDALPLVDVDADGAFGDLLSGEADRRLVPMRTPDGFNGTLRPFQERGLAWLNFLNEIGLGGILADSMGLGKCIGKDEFVFVNGALIKAKDVWARHASGSEPDAEGEWSVPAEPLTVNALAKDGRVVPAPITRLYRQHIRERVRKISLDDGSEIIVTRRHRLLGPDDWTRDVRPGARVCVPARLVHEGAPLDPDLTVLLAWQIAEGHEDAYFSTVITQKDERVLQDLQVRLLRLAERSGIRLNAPKIFPNAGGRAAYLRWSGISYRRFLEEHGYRWGGNSAHKRIPDSVVSADDTTVRLFLRHYFAAESSVDLSRRLVEISSASVYVIRQLSTMLRRFGIWLRVSTSWKCATNGTGTKRPYRIGLIGGSSLRRFADLIGIADQGKQSRLETICSRPHNTDVEGRYREAICSAAHTRRPASRCGTSGSTRSTSTERRSFPGRPRWKPFAEWTASSPGRPWPITRPATRIGGRRGRSPRTRTSTKPGCGASVTG